MLESRIQPRRRRGLLATSIAISIAAGFALAASAAAESPLVALPRQPEGVAWPTESWPEAAPGSDVDVATLTAAADALFASTGRGHIPDTRALLVVRGGQIVFERYAEGFGVDSRFHTWSMAKSFTHALAGVLVRQGRLLLDEPAAIPQWQGADDPRREITLRQLLNMTSGVDNADSSGDNASAGGFAGELLFGVGARDVNAFAAMRPLIHPPGTHWAYSTATSTLVAGLIGRTVADDAEGRRAFIQRELFEPIGAKDCEFEFDRTGQFLGGSHLWGTARDFARFGLLYLRDGIWEETRILPPGWVDFARTRAPVENNGTYGAHFWLNLEPVGDQFDPLPGGPTSVFEASGNAGQYVILVPSHDVILVRLGEMQATSWNTLNAQLAALLEAFPKREGTTP